MSQPALHCSARVFSRACKLTALFAFAVHDSTNGFKPTTSMPTLGLVSAIEIHSNTLRKLNTSTAWLDGSAIDAFMGWAIDRDIPYFEGVRDDYTAASEFFSAKQMALLPFGKATVIYFPTHLQVQFNSTTGLQALMNSDRCCTMHHAPCTMHHADSSAAPQPVPRV